MYNNHLYFKKNKGFTLVELLVTISIISILAAVIAVNSLDSAKLSRDEKRQADIRNLQSSLELYKNKYGRYPEACDAKVDAWAGQQGSNYACTANNQYIVGLAPEFISVLPIDPKLNGGDSGYVYRTNAKGTVYKLMVRNTVESEVVGYSHPLKSCDYNGTGDDDVNKSGWCANAYWNGNNTPDFCKAENIQFQKSYGVWSGFETTLNLTVGVCGNAGLLCGREVQHTSNVICR